MISTYRERGLENNKGSDAKDAWKAKHKKLSSAFFATDLDLLLITGRHDRRSHKIVALTDFKWRNTEEEGVLRFSHVVAYNYFIANNTPVYIIYADWDGNNEFSNIAIYSYISGNPVPEPPQIILVSILKNVSWGGYGLWEKKLRDDFNQGLKQM